MRALLLLSLLLVSCIEVNVSEQETGYEHIGIDDEFHPHVAEFERLWGHQVTNVAMFFVDYYEDDDGTIGMCMPNLSPRRLSISSNFWRTTTDHATRELLLFHELGHCVLELDHDETVDDEELPVSIMYPRITPTVEPYKAARAEFIKRLFNKPADTHLDIMECAP